MRIKKSPVERRLLRTVTMQRTLVIIGLTLAVVGLLWPWLGKIPFGRLPGDIIIDRPGFKFLFPITTMVLVSGVISLILWILRK
jgi:hypothetical protein